MRNDTYTRKLAITHVCVSILFLVVGQYVGYLMYSNPHIKLLFIPTFFIPFTGSALLIRPAAFFLLRRKNRNVVVKEDFDFSKSIPFFIVAIILSLTTIYFSGIRYQEYHLSKYLRKGKAIVTGFEYEKGKRYLLFSFISDDKTYNRLGNSNKYNVGDSIDIVFSFKNPNIVKIKNP